jgi:hypothetical protein
MLASRSGARAYPSTQSDWKNDLGVSCFQGQKLTHTLPPSSFELTVTTTEPMVTSEMTREKTCIDCSFGDWRELKRKQTTHIKAERDGQTEADDERAPEVPVTAG